MKAVLCTEFGGYEKLTLSDVPEPTAGEGEVVVDVAVASLNFPDLLTIKGQYQIKAEPPFVPGFEAAGVVSAVGEGVRNVGVGDRVAAVGVVGAFAEKWLVDAAACVPVPDGISDEAAACLTIAYGTSYHALKQRANLQQGETLLVLGASGGVGSAAVEIGELMGARVIAAASTDEKLTFCRELGASETVNYETEDLNTRVREITGGMGVDVIYDPVGGAISEQAFRAIGWNGRHLVIGFAAGDIPKVPWNLPLLKGASIVGVFWGSFTTREAAENQTNMGELLDFVRTGKLAPRVTAEFSLDDFALAYDMVASRQARGKVVLRV
ncbi:MAG: NADPH:quinone oxidoreductase family protein [Actinomycetota bacterium]|nr:NADPH:quinone oxidoreductase family protein [Actinomycetota bacterium]